MSSVIEINWVGYCNNDNSDKIWGICREIYGTEYTFWCRRGGTVKVKYHGYNTNTRSLVRSKEDKGYWEIHPTELSTLHPDLIEQLRRAIVLDKLQRN